MTIANASDARDYSLTGPENHRAVAAGLASAEWYHSDVPRRVMKGLMNRSDGPATRDTLLWFALLAGTAAGFIALWGSWWALPFLAADGLVMDDTIECPKHNGRFNYQTGAALGAPVCEALATYPARPSSGRIEIEIS